LVITKDVKPTSEVRSWWWWWWWW